jgi:hypothetical protein
MSKTNQPSGAGEPRSGTKATRREAAQAELRRVRTQQRRSRLLFTGAIVAVVVVIFGAVAIFGLHHKGGSGAATTAAGAKLETSLSTIPLASYDSVGTGTTSTPPKVLSGSKPMTEGGKPRILYVGAEYCPFCAAERWAMVSALMRFGSFSNLGQTTSAHGDVYPDTPTLSFHGATYTSKYLAFKGYETESNQVQGTGYAPLDKLSTADGVIFDKYDNPPYFTSQGSIPFIDFGGTFATQGASYTPQLFAGLTHQQVADQIADPSTDISKAVLGTANTFSAAICQLTKGQPSKVCTSQGVVAARGSLSQ